MLTPYVSTPVCQCGVSLREMRGIRFLFLESQHHSPLLINRLVKTNMGSTLPTAVKRIFSHRFASLSPFVFRPKVPTSRLEGLPLHFLQGEGMFGAYEGATHPKRRKKVPHDYVRRPGPMKVLHGHGAQAMAPFWGW